MYCLRHFLGAIALVGCSALFGSFAVTGCATDGARASDEAEGVVGEAASNQATVSAFVPTDVNAQVLAQATCTAIHGDVGWSFAIGRDCTTSAPDCNTLCSSLTDVHAGQLRCINSLHIYGNQPHSASATIGLKTFRYNSCGGACGPNYCCCGSSI